LDERKTGMQIKYYEALYYFARVVVRKYYKLKGLHNKNEMFHDSGYKSGMKVI
jgi:hypothetical protein